MGNLNKIKSENKLQKFAFNVLYYFIIIFSDFYLVFYYAQVKLKNGNQKILTLLDELQKSILQKPLGIELMNKAVQNEFIQTQKKLVPAYAVILIFLLLNKPKKNEFKGIEHGSARWAYKSEMKEFSKKKNTIVLSNELFLDPTNNKYNLNQLTIGGSGAGKSFYKGAPDIMQMFGSYVITDPKGDLYKKTAYFLKKNKYKVKVLNLIEPRYTNSYNPFVYLKDEKDVLIMVESIIKNTSDPKRTGGDEFWEQSQKALLQAISFYLWKERPKEEQCIEMVLKHVTSARVSDSDEGELEEDNPLEMIFTELAENDPYHIAVRSYNVFKLAAGKTAKSILVSLAVRLSIWNTKDIAIMTGTDEMEIEKIGVEKTAVFILIPETHGTFNVIASLFYTQLFQTLFREADHRPNGKLPLLVECILDEFANIGQIPDFDKLIATMRSRNIAAVPIIQALSQLKTMYKDSWQTILGCCDTFNFLGTTDQETLEYVSKKIGKTTVRVDTRSYSKGAKNSSRSDNTSYIARDLMSPNELFKLSKENNIVFIKGHDAFFTQKYKTLESSNYEFMSEKYYTDIIKEFTAIAEKKDLEYEKILLNRVLEEKQKKKEKAIAMAKKKLKENKKKSQFENNEMLIAQEMEIQASGVDNI